MVRGPPAARAKDLATTEPARVDRLSAAPDRGHDVSDTGQHNHDLLQDLRGQHRELRRAIPEVYAGFAELSKAALASGEVDAAIKELIAVAIGVVHGCDGCIAAHARAAVKAGATEQQAAEIIGVALMMAGGPATIYGARAFAAFREFADDSG
jgi:AhpD family alkylhydroperoxidase